MTDYVALLGKVAFVWAIIPKIYEYNRGMNQEINWIRNDLNKFISSTHDSYMRTAEQLRNINKELSDLNHIVSMIAIPMADIPNKIFDIRTIASEINSKTK